MKKYGGMILALLVALSSLLTMNIYPQASTASFFKRCATAVYENSTKYNLYGSVMMAQAAVESGWGKSQLSKQYHNYFGIKGSYNGHSVLMPTTEYDASGKPYPTHAYFKAYPSESQSFNDNGAMIRGNSRYWRVWRENAPQYSDAAFGLVSGGYATDPNYVQSLISIISYNNLHKRFDNGAPVTYQKVNRGAYFTKLSKKYRGYNHVQYTCAGIKRVVKQKMKGYRPHKKMIADHYGYSLNKTWIRVRFGKKGKKYWFKSGAITFKHKKKVPRKAR